MTTPTPILAVSYAVGVTTGAVIGTVLVGGWAFIDLYKWARNR